MIYRRLGPEDASRYRSLRISGLRESPSAFVSSAEEDEALLPEVTQERLRHAPDVATFGAFKDDELVGICTIKREKRIRLAHKANLLGVYVAPAARGIGAGRELIRLALTFAASMEVRQVNLGVNAANAPALRLYESLGFVAFGTEKQFMCIDGVFQDEIHMVCFLAIS